MNALLLLAGLSVAGELIIEAEIPAEIHLGGLPLVQVFHPSEVRVRVEPGEVELTVYTGGSPSRYQLEIPEEGAAVVVVGRTGTTTGRRVQPPPPADAPPLDLEVRNAAAQAVMFVVDRGRHAIESGGTLSLQLTPGDHPVSVRNGQGTLVWARGTLHVRAGEGPVLVQVAEGVLPEVARGPATFSPYDAP